jgi:hypothetical protein
MLSTSSPYKSMGKHIHEFFWGFLRIIIGNDYLYVVVDKFTKRCVLMTCINTNKGQEATTFFFERVSVHFGISRSIISNKDTRFISAF